MWRNLSVDFVLFKLAVAVHTVKGDPRVVYPLEGKPKCPRSSVRFLIKGIRVYDIFC